LRQHAGQPPGLHLDTRPCNAVASCPPGPEHGPVHPHPRWSQRVFGSWSRCPGPPAAGEPAWPATTGLRERTALRIASSSISPTWVIRSRTPSATSGAQPRWASFCLSSARLRGAMAKLPQPDLSRHVVRSGSIRAAGHREPDHRSQRWRRIGLISHPGATRPAGRHRRYADQKSTGTC